MKLRPQALFCLLIVLFFAVFVYQATDWRLQARLYPWVIGIPMIFLALAQLIFELKGIGEKKSAGNAPVDFQFTQNIDPALARSRTLNIFSWIFGFTVGI